MNTRRKLIFLVFFITAILAYYETVRVDAPGYELKFLRHSGLISNTIEYPYKYRLLNPFTANIWFTMFKLVLSEKTSFLLAYFVQNLLVYGFMNFCLTSLFSYWFDYSGTAIAILMFSLLVPLSITGYDSLGNMITAGLMAAAFFFILKGRIGALFPIIFIGAFNELQIILVIIFYFFSKKENYLDKKVWRNSIALTLTFTASYFLIYLLRGSETTLVNRATVNTMSVTSWDYIKWYFTKDADFNIKRMDWIILWSIMIVPLFPFVIRNFNKKPEFLRRNAMITLPLFYFFAFFFIARLRETEKALTLFIILIPLALFTILPNHLKSYEVET